jgi:hypothetical protein
MPQETKSMPRDREAREIAPGIEHENLEGWIPRFATDDDIRSALEKAFDYRGDVTITLNNGSKVEGFIFDRTSDAATLDECRVRILPKDRDDKVTVSYAQIARLEFTGRDTAAGKGFETWVKKYWEKKRAGEKNIRIEPENLD